MNINFKQIISTQKTTKIFITLMLFLFSFSLSQASLATISVDAEWARSVTTGGISNSEFNSVTADVSGNVYAGGYIMGTGTYDFGNGVTASGTSGTYNTVLVKYANTGTALWAKSVTTGPGPFESYFFSVTIDTNGNVYAGGYIDGSDTYDFGNGVTVSGANSAGDNIVLVKYDSTGAALWAKSVTRGFGSSDFYSVTADTSGNVYAGGKISRIGIIYDFGNGVITSGAYDGDNAVLVKYDSTGTALWAAGVSGSSDSRFYSVTVDASGNVYAGGWMWGPGTYDFGNGVTISGSSSNANIVLVKYDSAGTAQWAKSMVGGSSGSYLSVTVDATGNVYAAGSIRGTGTYDFGNGVTASGSAGSANIVLVKYDSTGTTLWAKSVISGTSNSSFWRVTVDGSGNVYAAGYIEGNGTYDFGNGVTASGTSSDFNSVLVKYDSTGTAQWAKSVTSGSLRSVFNSVTADTSGNLYAGGYITGTGTYDFGNGVTASGAYDFSNTVLVKYKPIPSTTSSSSLSSETSSGSKTSSLSEVSYISGTSSLKPYELFR